MTKLTRNNKLREGTKGKVIWTRKAKGVNKHSYWTTTRRKETKKETKKKMDGYGPYINTGFYRLWGKDQGQWKLEDINRDG